MLRRQPSWVVKLSSGHFPYWQRSVKSYAEPLPFATWTPSRQASNDAKRSDQSQTRERRVAAAVASKEIQSISQGRKPTVAAPIDLRSLNETPGPLRFIAGSHSQHSAIERSSLKRVASGPGEKSRNNQNIGLSATTGTLAPKRYARGSYRSNNYNGSKQRQSTKFAKNAKSQREGDSLNAQLLEEEAEIFTEDDAIESDFESATELRAYMRLNSALERLCEMEKELFELQESGVKSEQIKNLQDQINTGLTESLKFLADTKSALSNPPHVPENQHCVQPTGSIGDVPVGKGSMARVVEDGLRYFVQRQNMHWQDPKALTGNFLDAKLMKFKDHYERKEVLHFLRYEPSFRKSRSAEAMGSPLPLAAQRKIVEHLVRGDYADPNNTSVKGDVLRNMIRITTGNSSLHGSQTHKMVNTVQTLLPSY